VLMNGRYSGSLTTPPCDEDIAWHVSCRPLTISVATYQIVKDVVKFNARFTQNTPGEINLLENVANELCGSA
jgi:carbonic anhydrase